MRESCDERESLNEFSFFQLTLFVKGVKVDRWLNFSMGTGQTGGMVQYVSSAQMQILATN